MFRDYNIIRLIHGIKNRYFSEWETLTIEPEGKKGQETADYYEISPRKANKQKIGFTVSKNVNK